MVKRHSVNVLREKGHSQREVAERLDVSERSVRNIEHEPVIVSLDDVAGEPSATLLEPLELGRRRAWPPSRIGLSSAHPLPQRLGAAAQLAATDVIAAHCDGCWSRSSSTSLTARSFSSFGYLVPVPIGSSFPCFRASGKAGPIHCA